MPKCPFATWDEINGHHLSLDKDAPDGRPIERPEEGTIVQIPEVGGLHHRYLRRAA